MANNKFLLGCDPELFLINPNSGKPVSAFGLIKGTKDTPFKVDKGAYQVDGLAAEFNIDAASSYEEWEHNIKVVMDQLKKATPGYDFSHSPVAIFDKDYFDAQPEESKELGCNPDFNAWLGGAETPKPDNKTTMRTAAGHVHIGFTEDAEVGSVYHDEVCQMVTKQLDYALALPSLMFDKDKLRRSMYGKAGCYRPKSYGVEYRTLSNFWIFSKEYRAWVYDTTIQALKDLQTGNLYYEKRGDWVCDAVNNSRVEDYIKYKNDTSYDRIVERALKAG